MPTIDVREEEQSTETRIKFDDSDDYLILEDGSIIFSGTDSNDIDVCLCSLPSVDNFIKALTYLKTLNKSGD